MLQLRKTHHLEGDLDEATTEEVESLRRVPAVADVGATDRDHLDDRLEHRGTQVRAGRESNAYDGATRSNVQYSTADMSCQHELSLTGGQKTGAMVSERRNSHLCRLLGMASR